MKILLFRVSIEDAPGHRGAAAAAAAAKSGGLGTSSPRLCLLHYPWSPHAGPEPPSRHDPNPHGLGWVASLCCVEPCGAVGHLLHLQVK